MKALVFLENSEPHAKFYCVSLKPSLLPSPFLFLATVRFRSSRRRFGGPPNSSHARFCASTPSKNDAFIHPDKRFRPLGPYSLLHCVAAASAPRFASRIAIDIPQFEAPQVEFPATVLFLPRRPAVSSSGALSLPVFASTRSGVLRLAVVGAEEE